jgi:hypothetical protein
MSIGDEVAKAGASWRPDERVFRYHLGQGPFQNGVDRGYWRLIGITWPHVLIGVRASPREEAPDEYVLRFECTDYPRQGPTAQPWDPQMEGPLLPARWPTGRSRVALAFNPAWKGGQCLYLPCDRLSIEGHDPWHTQHPDMIWSPSDDMTQYLRIVHDLLTSSDYTGIRGT